MSNIAVKNYYMGTTKLCYNCWKNKHKTGSYFNCGKYHKIVVHLENTNNETNEQQGRRTDNNDRWAMQQQHCPV